MQKKTDVIDEEGNEALDPMKALAEQTLSVDLARVEYEQAIVTAHKFPRSIDAVVRKIHSTATYNREMAENCIYALPRGGKPIVGPSIGFASIVYQAYGNCRLAVKQGEIDRREKFVSAYGRFYDLESNTETIVPATRRIVDRHGRLYNDDMILVTMAACCSIAARNAIFRAVPRGFYWPSFQDALTIVRGDGQTFAEVKERALKAMAQFGVKPEQIFLALGIKGEIELLPDHIPTVRGMYTALRDGSMTVEEMFDPRRMTGKGFETVENPLGDGGEPASGDTTSAATAAAEPDAPEPDETHERLAKLDQKGVIIHAPVAPEKGWRSAETARVPEQDHPQPAQVAQTTQEAPADAPKPETALAVTPRPAQAVPEAAAISAITLLAAAGSARAAAATGGFREPEEYLAYWESFIAECKSLGALIEKWSSDRNLRTRCKVIGDPFTQAKVMRDQAEERLRKTGAA